VGRDGYMIFRHLFETHEYDGPQAVANAIGYAKFAAAHMML